VSTEALRARLDRATLRANGLCIECKGDHRGVGMRCEKCRRVNCERTRQSARRMRAGRK